MPSIITDETKKNHYKTVRKSFSTTKLGDNWYLMIHDDDEEEDDDDDDKKKDCLPAIVRGLDDDD